MAGGEFGAFMQVHIQNDGPVTLHIESPQFPPPKEVALQYKTCMTHTFSYFYFLCRGNFPVVTTRAAMIVRRAPKPVKPVLLVRLDHRTSLEVALLVQQWQN